MNRHRKLTPDQRADDLDRRLTELLKPTQAQLAGVLAFLDHLSRTEDRDYRAELAVFWVGRHVEQRKPRRLRGTE